MTNPNYTHLTLVVDRSGSMHEVQSDAQGGITSLLDEQFALPDALTVTLVEFDTDIETVRRMTSEVFDYQLQPRGMTALMDAVGSEIVRTGQDLAALPESDRPGRVLFVIVTDGQENASVEYSLEKVREMVRSQREEFAWDFQFIGAGEAAWQGHDLGMAAASYRDDGEGTRALYNALSASITAYRSSDASSAVLDLPADLDTDSGGSSDSLTKTGKRSHARGNRIA